MRASGTPVASLPAVGNVGREWRPRPDRVCSHHLLLVSRLRSLVHTRQGAPHRFPEVRHDAVARHANASPRPAANVSDSPSPHRHTTSAIHRPTTLTAMQLAFATACNYVRSVITFDATSEDNRSPLLTARGGEGARTRWSMLSITRQSAVLPLCLLQALTSGWTKQSQLLIPVSLTSTIKVWRPGRNRLLASSTDTVLAHRRAHHYQHSFSRAFFSPNTARPSRRAPFWRWPLLSAASSSRVSAKRVCACLGGCARLVEPSTDMRPVQTLTRSASCTPCWPPLPLLRRA